MCVCFLLSPPSKIGNQSGMIANPLCGHLIFRVLVLTLSIYYLFPESCIVFSKVCRCNHFARMRYSFPISSFAPFAGMRYSSVFSSSFFSSLSLSLSLSQSIILDAFISRLFSQEEQS